jgi:hypothetical protein
VVNPIELITSTEFPGMEEKVNLPSMSVLVIKLLLPFTTTVANETGVPSSEEVTVPVTLVCAKAVWVNKATSARIRIFFIECFFG